MPPKIENGCNFFISLFEKYSAATATSWVLIRHLYLLQIEKTIVLPPGGRVGHH